MQIQKINTYKFSFGGLKEAEKIWQDSKPAVREALSELGDKNLAILMHGISFPSLPEEDFSIGSPYSNGAKEFFDFFGGIFDKCVLGPWGLTSESFKHSPYNSMLESLNPFFINFKYLTTSEGNNLLSEETFDKIVKNSPKKSNHVNYSYVQKNVSKMLDEAFLNYQKKLSDNELNIIKMSEEIELFKKENNGIYLDAIYDSLTREYKDPDFRNWSDVDKELPLLIEKDDDTAKKRLSEIYEQHKSQIDRYMFIQYLAKEHVKLAPVLYIADKQVALRTSDEWKLQDIILRNIGSDFVSLGVPGDSFSPKGRCWGIPQIDPKKLFNNDDTLTDGGKRLFEIYRGVFRKNKGGVRIDHFQGIIDPYLCVNKSPEAQDGAGRLLSSPNHYLFGDYSILNEDNINLSKQESHIDRVINLTEEQISLYGKFFERIILAAAKAEGLDKSSIMPEDLGSITKPTVEVIKRNGLGSMKVTQFVNPSREDHIYRGKNSAPQDFITTGTHDSQSLVNYFYNMPQSKYNNHINMLSKDLNLLRPHNKKDRNYGIKLKFAELFVAPAKNVQIFFTHLMGMSDWYNKPGDKSVPKWSLRIPNNFKEIYFKNMIAGIAFNPFDALVKALRTKGCSKYAPLINKLKNYERKIAKAL